MSTLGSRIKEARIAAGYTDAAKAAEALGIKAPAYRMYERDDREPTYEALAAIAKKFGRSIDWLLTARESRGRKSSARGVPLVGYVGAGAEAVLFAEGQGPFDEVERPDDATDDTVAVEIRGDSLGPFFNEWIVFYNDVRSPVTPDMYRQLCVVGLPDGRILIKKLQPSREPGRFHLLSQTEGPILDAEVEWAAVVINMKPRI